MNRPDFYRLTKTKSVPTQFNVYRKEDIVIYDALFLSEDDANRANRNHCSGFGEIKKLAWGDQDYPYQNEGQWLDCINEKLATKPHKPHYTGN